MSRYTTFYKHVISYDLVARSTYLNSFQLPDIETITISLSSTTMNKTKILNYFLILELLTSQQGHLCFSKRNKIQLNIKKNTLVGCKVTLNKRQSYEFLETLITCIFPTTNQFLGIQLGSVSLPISFSLSESSLFPELRKEFRLTSALGSDSILVTLNFKATSITARNLLLTAFNFPKYSPISRK